MLRVDRKNFMTDESFQTAYSDFPRPIRYSTTISAPSMHAATLEKLKDHLLKSKKCIDIGTGSGFLAACFAEIIPKDSKVIMLDHIEGIID
mmetsp:Transcript_10041/g.9983  ORF Transcript_10041/g.9983 Transcript_10041/m.9983 type:complete len:91 (+) Transcript_10041:331-603(+)